MSDLPRRPLFKFGFMLLATAALLYGAVRDLDWALAVLSFLPAAVAFDTYRDELSRPTRKDDRRG